MSDKKMQEPYEDFLTFAAITNPFFKGQDMVPPEMSQTQEDTKSSEDFKSHKNDPGWAENLWIFTKKLIAKIRD
ncbi:MAG: hypothetical protein OXG09_10410 [Chloroflexi bacterium]|nr:hypothetical protein [Chloroflexota bacterium]